ICDGKDNNCDGQIDEGASLCDDGNLCNGHETCASGACVAGTPLNCDDHNPCTVDSCDPVAGCVHTNVADGTACNDGNACTQTDDGARRGAAASPRTAPCPSGTGPGSAGAPCTAGDPTPSAGNSSPPAAGCANPAKADGTACNDGNACTQTDTCQSGTCTGSN